MNKIAKIISIIALIFFALITNSWGDHMFDKKLSVKENMEKYMRTTYGKEFVLSEPRLVGGGWGRPATTYVSKKAYPVDDHEIKFDISWDTQERTYIDTYLAARWSMEGRMAMERKLREVYGEGNFFIRKYFSAWNDAKDQKFTWADVMKNRSQCNRIDFSYFVFFDGALNRKKEAQRAYKILKANFIDYKVRQYHFSVYLMYSNKKKEFFDMWTDEKRRKHEDQDTMHKSELLKDWIRVNYSKIRLENGSNKILDQEVKSAEDLLNTRFQIKEGK